MTAMELRSKIEDYEKYNNIYMNFSVDETGVWGLPEGDKTQHILRMDKLNQYKEFLHEAVKHYENMSRFNPLCKKKVDKYKRYIKRLENALKKVK